MPSVDRTSRQPATARAGRSQPAAKMKPTAQVARPPAAGWTGKSTPAQARALFRHLRTADGSAQAGKIIDAVVRQNDLARDLNWEAANITGIKPLPGTKHYVADVTLEVLKDNGTFQKHYFSAIVDQRGKVVDVPQG